MTSPLPLEGLRVLELGHIIAGPSAGLLLADLGADVIKVERPGEGDQSRGMPAGHLGQLPLPQPQQALDRDRPQGLGGGPRALPAAGRAAPTWSSTTSPTAPSRPSAWATTCWRASNPGIIYLALKGFLPGPDEAPPLPRRAGPDVGRARLHDRAARPAAARGRLDRGRGRRGLRGDRGAGRDPPARADQPRPEDHLGALRDHRLLGRPVAGATTRPPASRRCRCRRSARARGWAGASTSSSPPPTASRSSSASPPTPTGSASVPSSASHDLLADARLDDNAQARGRPRLAARPHRRGDGAALERGAVGAAGAGAGTVRAAAPARSAGGRSAPRTRPGSS